MTIDYDIQFDDKDLYVEIEKNNKENQERIKRYAEYLSQMVKHKSFVLIDELVEERKRQGLTPKNIAERSGVATSDITRFEGKKSTPTLQFLEKYAAALGKEVVYELKDR